MQKSIVSIGGSGSTGSSLLTQILNRHSKINAGPERYLFAYPQLFDFWESYKQNTAYIKSNGWVLYKGLHHLKEKPANFKSFQKFVKAEANTVKEPIFIDKTPSNCLSFNYFLETFSNGKVIQTFRNPFDTIASLSSRGMSVYYATGYYLFNTIIGLNVADNNQYCAVWYEDLVKQPRISIERLCTFLNIKFEPQMLEGVTEQSTNETRLNGWLNDETHPISQTSLNRFNKLNEDKQQLIYTALHTFTFKPAFVKQHRLKANNFKALCNLMNWQYRLQAPNRGLVWKLKLQQWRDWQARTRRLYPSGWFSYPSSLTQIEH